MTRVRLGVLLVVALVVLAACSNGAPSTAPVPDASTTAVRYVALGGDDVYGGRERLAGSWPQLLFREHLAVNASLVNLASPRRGAAEMRRDQLPDALRLRPSIVTITAVDDLDRGTPLEDVQRDLRALIRPLLAVPGARVLVGTAPPGSAAPAAVAGFNAAVTLAVRSTGAELVELGSVTGTTSSARAEQTAAAFARVLDHP